MQTLSAIYEPTGSIHDGLPSIHARRAIHLFCSIQRERCVLYYMFLISLINVLLMLAYIVPSFLLCKAKKVTSEHLPSISTLLLYVCSPCLTFVSVTALEYSTQNLINLGLFFLVTLILQAAVMAVIYLIFRKKYNQSKYRILTIGTVMGNVGFFGLPVIRALFPASPEVMTYSAAFVVSMNVLVYTVGVFCLTQNKKYMSVKPALLNPTTIGFAIAIPFFVTGATAYLPDIVMNAVTFVGNMSTPLCMFILGIRLASVSFKKLFARPVVYLTCLSKLIIFPLVSYAAVYFLPLPVTFKASILILSATPCANIILSLAEIHRSETELSANSVLVSTLLCFMTIPLLTLLI